MKNVLYVSTSWEMLRERQIEELCEPDYQNIHSMQKTLNILLNLKHQQFFIKSLLGDVSVLMTTHKSMVKL